MGYFDDSLGYATLEGTSRHFLPKLKERGEAEAWKSSPIGGELTRTKAASAAMGYTLQATRTSVTYNQVKATVVVEIKNTGVAPFYATWLLEVILVDENNEIVTSQTIESTLPSILPDQTGKVTARLPLPDYLELGKLTRGRAPKN